MNKVSVCIASYNGEQFIEKQLISILSQLADHDEIIISDDCSTDETVSVIKRLKDERILIFLNNGIHGPVSNFEETLKRATGDFIFLADQDDVWLPGKISSMKSLLHSYDLVLSDCVVVNKENEVIQPSFFKFRGSRPGFWHNIYKNSYMGCCMAFRREVLHYVLPFPAQIHMHDWWIGLMVEAKGSVYFYAQPTIHYVRHGANLSPTGENGYGMVRRIVNRVSLLSNILKRVTV